MASTSSPTPGDMFPRPRDAGRRAIDDPVARAALRRRAVRLALLLVPATLCYPLLPFVLGVTGRRFVQFRRALVRYEWTAVELTRYGPSTYVCSGVPGPVHHFTCDKVLPRQFVALVAAPTPGSGVTGRPCVIRPRGTDHVLLARGPFASDRSAPEPMWVRHVPSTDLPKPAQLGPPPDTVWAVRADVIGFAVHHRFDRDDAQCGIWTFDGELCGSISWVGSDAQMSDRTGRIVLEREDRYRAVVFADGARDVARLDKGVIRLSDGAPTTWQIRCPRRTVLLVAGTEAIAHGTARSRGFRDRTAHVVVAAGLDPVRRRIALLHACLALHVPTRPSS